MKYDVFHWFVIVMELMMMTCLAGDIDMLVRTAHDFNNKFMSKFMSNGHELMTQHPVKVAIRSINLQTVITLWILTF